MPIPHLDSTNFIKKKDIDLNCYPFKHDSFFPKIIHLVHAKLEFLEKSCKEWSELNPSYQIELYDDERCQHILMENFGKLYVDVFNFIKDGPIKCDFFRVCLLYLKGGIYVDADIKPLVPLSEFLDDDTDFATCISYNFKDTKKQVGWSYNPQFILAKKYDSYLYSIIHKYIMYYQGHVEYNYWRWSICALMHRVDINNDFSFNVMLDSDNVFLLNGKKYKFVIEHILDTTNHVSYNYTNWRGRDTIAPNCKINVCCTDKNKVVFNNFDNKQKK
jgi:hypothetical protein